MTRGSQRSCGVWHRGTEALFTHLALFSSPSDPETRRKERASWRSLPGTRRLLRCCRDRVRELKACDRVVMMRCLRYCDTLKSMHVTEPPYDGNSSLPSTKMREQQEVKSQDSQSCASPDPLRNTADGFQRLGVSFGVNFPFQSLWTRSHSSAGHFPQQVTRPARPGIAKYF